MASPCFNAIAATARIDTFFEFEQMEFEHRDRHLQNTNRPIVLANKTLAAIGARREVGVPTCDCSALAAGIITSLSAAPTAPTQRWLSRDC